MGLAQFAQEGSVMQSAAVAEVDDRAHDSGSHHFAARDGRVVPDELGPFHGKLWARLPEVDAVSEPIVVVRAAAQMRLARTGEHPLCDGLVATVEAEDKTGLELVKVPHTTGPALSAFEPLREFSSRCCDASAL